MKTNIEKFLLCFAVLTTFSAADVCAAFWQQDENKGIQAVEYLKKRPTAKISGGRNYSQASGKKPPASAAKRFYRPVKSKKTKPPPKVSANLTETAQIGFTMWRVKSDAAENESKGIVEVDLQKSERAEIEPTLHVGETFRLGVEPLSHNGFLYIVNREKFADGSYGTPTLLFPTLSSRGGNNFVRAGVLSFLPAYGKVFKIAPAEEKKQIAEELIIIVSPKLLIDPQTLRPSAISLAPAQIGEWLALWQVEDFQAMELVDGAKEFMTAAEEFAWREQSKKIVEVTPTLTQTDAPPHIVYQMKIKRGTPALIIVTLPIKAV